MIIYGFFFSDGKEGVGRNFFTKILRYVIVMEYLKHLLNMKLIKIL